jgi:hypothetical protein
MNTTLIWGILAILVSLPLASANLYITEVMHSPTQTQSDSDGEWVEIYNSGEESVNLRNWTIDGKIIGSFLIESGEYFVIARELLDSEDEDTESFEGVWGNNNGVWDESFKAADVTIALSSEDTVTLSNGNEIESISYDESYGGENGRTIQRINLTSWEESEVGGSPGYGSFQVEKEKSKDDQGLGDFLVYLNVKNVAPKIVSLNLTIDDSTSQGIQILPGVGYNRTVGLKIFVNDSNGIGDIENVTAVFRNQTFNAIFENGTYLINLSLDPQLLAGDYEILVYVTDGELQASEKINFSYLSVISTNLNASSLIFDSSPGEMSELSVDLENQGNTQVVTTIRAEEFTGESNLPALYLSLYTDSWKTLETTVVLEEIGPGQSRQLLFRLSLPYSVSSGEYTSKIVIESMEV